MTRGGRRRRGSRGGEVAFAPRPSAVPTATQPPPLADVSTSTRPKAAAALKSPVATGGAAPATALPGLEHGLPAEPQGRLPVAEQGVFEAFGDALRCLRVTSLTRSASARCRSLLRLVQQPGEAEGRRTHGLPPAARPLLRATTQPLLDGCAAPPARGRRRRSPHNGQVHQEHSTESARSLMQQENGGARSSLAQLPSSPAAAASTQVGGACGKVASPASPAAGTGGGGSMRQDLAYPSLLPPPLPVRSGAGLGTAVAVEAGEEDQESAGLEQAARSQPPADEQSCRPEDKAVFCGLSTADEAAALPDEAPPPAWLVRQGHSNATGKHVQPCPALSVQPQQAAALWRMQWLSGVQWHNAVRAGGPLCAGSKLSFAPLDPNEPLLEVLMFHAAVMPASVVAGTARFQDIVLGDPTLHRQALEEAVLRFGQWGMPTRGGGYTLVAGGSQLALPLSFRKASEQLLALFLACVWAEANNREAVQALAYGFAAGGERKLDVCQRAGSLQEATLRYPVSELQLWLRLALGGRPAAAHSASATLAALRTVALFGTE